MSLWSRTIEAAGKLLLVALASYFSWASFQAWHPIVRAYRAESWPAVAGVVTSSQVQVGCGRGTSRFPRVEYRYVAEGIARHSAQIAFGNMGCGSQHEAEEVIANYPVGREVIVHISPVDSDVSVLMVGSVFMGTWFMALFFTALASLFIAQAWRHTVAK